MTISLLHIRFARLNALLATALLLPGLVLAQAAGGPAPAPRSAELPPPAAQSVDPNQYVIGPGDALQVFVWRNPDLTATVPVRPDGKISTPLVEDMVAVGKTPSQLARDIEKVLSEYVRSPTVNVIVNQPVGAYSQIQIIGQVTKPGSLPYRAGMKVLDAVLIVGGLTQFAAGNRAKIVRTVDNHKQQIRVKLDALVNKGDMSQNLDLRPGDVLVVPESIF
ncbi:MAG: polysaccharide export outer membrane protein [Gammaproteobacteria bacterium]|nr:polysaccharide export outer membrane protein [Gammaproteobacteria bacterium]